MLRSSFLRALALGVFAFLGGCSDLPMAPQMDGVAPSFASGPGSDGLGDLGRVLGTGQVQVIERRVPLAEDEIVSAVIGRLGGVIRLPKAGLTVTFPYDAVRTPTRITVRAPAGNHLGYDFQPHGLEFRRDVTVVQDLLNTNALGLSESDLQVVYFDGELAATVTPLEICYLRIRSNLAIWQIEHFSGYAVSRRGYVVATD